MRRLLIRPCWLLLILLTTACSQQNPPLQGYVEGRFTYISTPYAGILKQLQVQRGEQVHNAQPLFVLEQQPESTAYHQAQAKVDQTQALKIQAQAALTLATLNLQRQSALYKKGATQQASVDDARANFEKTRAGLMQSNADLAGAQAALTQAQWSQTQKTVAASKNAIVFDTYFLPGELVPAGQPVLSLLAAHDVSIIFFVSAAQLTTLHYGQTIAISCDHCPMNLTATINFISPQAEYTPPIIYSNETNAKLIFHIEAKPAAATVGHLHPGQPVTVQLMQ
jgi:HlyD family secretion protein